MRYLTATPELRSQVDQILTGKIPSTPKSPGHPLFINITKAAEMLGESRPTVYRLIDEDRLELVQLRHNSKRLRYADVLALAQANSSI